MKKPDELVVEIERSMMGKALVISLIAHFVLLGGTSFSLFRDWAVWGVHSPSYINAQKSKANKEAEAEQRKKAAEEKAAAAAAQAESNKTAKASAPAKGATAAAKDGKAAPAAAAAGDEKKTPPEVEAMPPKKEFELGDDLSLD